MCATVALVLDCSGSMQLKQRMTMMRQSVPSMLCYLKPGTNVHVITFDDATLHSSYELSENQNVAIGDSIKAQTERHGRRTNLYKALEEANELEPDICLVITDGHQTIKHPQPDLARSRTRFLCMCMGDPLPKKSFRI